MVGAALGRKSRGGFVTVLGGPGSAAARPAEPSASPNPASIARRDGVARPRCSVAANGSLASFRMRSPRFAVSDVSDNKI